VTALEPLVTLAHTASVTDRSALSSDDRDAMHALLDAHFAGVTRAQFDADLNAKDVVLRVFAGAQLIGFTTLAVTHTEVDGDPLHVVYSGDTIMSPEGWGSPVLARAWIAMIRTLQGDRAHERWLWLLLSSGYRTYRFLPVFWREFWPRHDTPMPAPVRALRDQLASQRFGEAYDPRDGIVRFARPQQLRGALAEVAPGREQDPHIAFFLATNPGHARGDELVCLADLSDANLTAAGHRMRRPPRK
jgi:hypothetical protein